MDMEKLFSGIAVIIDDEIATESANIRNILKQLDDKNIPYLKYDKLPKDDIVSNLKNVAFILLDWQLSEIDIPGVRIPDDFQLRENEEKINFLKKVRDNCFCPVFIFTNASVDQIEVILEEQGLYSKDKCSMFLIKPKNAFSSDDSLFPILTDWLNDNPPMYLLKNWDFSYNDAKTKLFIDFQKRSPSWPKYLWQTYEKDEANPSVEFVEFISRSIMAQVYPFNLDKNIFRSTSKDVDSTELTACLERQYFINNQFLDEKLSTGDVFKIAGDSVEYYVNIRPECDMIARDSSVAEEIEMYLLIGKELNKHDMKEKFLSKTGTFNDIEKNFTIFPICEGKCLHFDFKSLKIMKCSELKDKRVGRILSPHINRLQMKYASYLQRPGLPRIPDGLFK